MSPADRLLYRLFLGDIAAPWQWPKGAERPEDWQRIRFAGQVGKPLFGLWGTATGEAKGTIVCAHPVRSDAKGFFLRSGVARLLREAGYHVFLFDFNGFGESPRSTFRYVRDIEAAVREVARLAPGLPMGLHGACFGATSGLHLLPTEDNPFRAVLVEGAPRSWMSYYSTLPGARRSLRVRYLRLRARLLLGFGAFIHPTWADQLRPLDALLAAHNVRSVLFLYGQDDPLIPAHVGQDLFDTCRQAWAGRPDAPTSDLWIAPRSRHLAYYAADPEGYRRRVVAFWDQHLASAAQPEALVTG